MLHDDYKHLQQKVAASKELQLDLNNLNTERHTDKSHEHMDISNQHEDNDVDVCKIVVKNPAAKKYVKGSQANTDANHVATPKTQESYGIRGVGEYESDMDDIYKQESLPSGKALQVEVNAQSSCEDITLMNSENTGRLPLQSGSIYQDNSAINQSKSGGANNKQGGGSNFTDFRKMNINEKKNKQFASHTVGNDNSYVHGSSHTGVERMDWDLQNGNLEHNSPKPARKVTKSVKKKDSFSKKSRTDDSIGGGGNNKKYSNKQLQQISKTGDEHYYGSPRHELSFAGSKFIKKKDKNKSEQQEHQEQNPPQSRIDFSNKITNSDSHHDDNIDDENYYGTPRPAIDIPEGGANNMNRNSTYIVSFTAGGGGGGSQQYQYGNQAYGTNSTSTQQQQQLQHPPPPPHSQQHAHTPSLNSPQQNFYSQPYDQNNYSGGGGGGGGGSTGDMAQPQEEESSPHGSPRAERRAGKVS